MIAEAPKTCEHCGLSLGTWPYRRAVDGEDHGFCCYGCFIGWQVGRGGGDEATAAGLLIRLGLGAFLAMNIMLFSLAIYSGGIDAAEPWVRQVFHYVLWAFATPVMVILGGPFIAEAASDLMRGRLGASMLVSIGAVAAYVHSAIGTLAGSERVYFDTATMVLGLFTLGRFLEANGRARAVRSLAPMLRPRSLEVQVVSGGQQITKRLSAVRAGDRIRVLPGDRIAVDGTVAEGRGFVDESWLTGEAAPVARGVGEAVLAGTINLDGVLVIRATADGLKTRWAAICRSLHDSLTQPTAMQTLTDRVAAWFIPVVLAVGLATVWYWASAGPFEDALMHGLAVLVVACPCALGLAAPLATASALERLALTGVLVRSGDVLSGLAAATRLAVDKTGTLTRGGVRVAGVVAHGASEDDVLRRAASLEAGSRHPLAQGIVHAAAERGLERAPAEGVRAVAGRGLMGAVDTEAVAVGSALWFAELAWMVPQDLAERMAGAEKRGLSAVYVGWDRTVRGLVLLNDEIRGHSSETVRALQRAGVSLCVLSGDGPGPVARIAGECGIQQWRAGLSPEEKAAAIGAWRRDGHAVAMVGDGINDGQALRAADVGIAVGGAVDLARETADVVLPGAGLEHLPGVIARARYTRRLVRTNLAWALAYNIIAIGLAASGLLQPVIAAALMAGSSFLVIANSLRREQPVTRPSGTVAGSAAQTADQDAPGVGLRLAS